MPLAGNRAGYAAHDPGARVNDVVKRLNNGLKEIKDTQVKAVKTHNRAVRRRVKRSTGLDLDDSGDEASDNEDDEDDEDDEGDDTKLSFAGSTKNRGGVCSTDLSLRGHMLALCKVRASEGACEGAERARERGERAKLAWGQG
jgi:hypothetical protein